MSDINDIPYEDVLRFLRNNNQKVPYDKEQAYDLLFELIQTNDYDYYTNSIIEWIMAYNLLQLNIKIPKYKTSELLSLNDNQLLKLSKLLKMKSTKLNHIMNILKYLHKLENDQDYLDLLPNELLGHIIENTNSKSITKFCSSSKKLDNLCYSREYRDILQRKLSDIYLDLANFSNNEVKNYFQTLYLKRRLTIGVEPYLIENNKLFRMSSAAPLINIRFKPIETICDKEEFLYDNVSQIADYYEGYLYILKINGTVILLNLETFEETEFFVLDKIIDISSTENLDILNIKTANGDFYQWFYDRKKLVKVTGLKNIIQVAHPNDDPNKGSFVLTINGYVYEMINTDDVYNFNQIIILENIIQISSDNKYFLNMYGDVFTLENNNLHLELKNVKQISNGGALTVGGEFFDLKTKELIASNIVELPMAGYNRFCLNKNGEVLEVSMPYNPFKKTKYASVEDFLKELEYDDDEIQNLEDDEEDESNEIELEEQIELEEYDEYDGYDGYDGYNGNNDERPQ